LRGFARLGTFGPQEEVRREQICGKRPKLLVTLGLTRGLASPPFAGHDVIAAGIGPACDLDYAITHESVKRWYALGIALIER
jgi:hypothetical protein